jgi:hypothetical protein
MVSGYTIFVTYLLKPTVVAGGYSPAIHCNYISGIILNTNNPVIEEVRFYFPEIGDFKFLSTNIASGTGYTANKLYALIQLVNNSGFTSISNVKPDPALWKIVDVTNQILGYVSGATLSPSGLTSVVFKVPLNNYNSFSGYSINANINGINYPSTLQIADSELCFGDETYFLGNVSADIHADVYTTNLALILPANQFNSSTNSTWNGQSVYATEIGIYDANMNLVAIGKFNDPMEKNLNISRTVLFAVDF